MYVMHECMYDMLCIYVQYYVAQYSPSTVKRSRKGKDRMGSEGKLLISENARYKPKTV